MSICLLLKKTWIIWENFFLSFGSDPCFLPLLVKKSPQKWLFFVIVRVFPKCWSISFRKKKKTFGILIDFIYILRIQNTQRKLMHRQFRSFELSSSVIRMGYYPNIIMVLCMIPFTKNKKKKKKNKKHERREYSEGRLYDNRHSV